MARALGFRFDYEHEQERLLDLVELKKVEKPKWYKLIKQYNKILRRGLTGAKAAEKKADKIERVAKRTILIHDKESND